MTKRRRFLLEGLTEDEVDLLIRAFGKIQLSEIEQVEMAAGLYGRLRRAQRQAKGSLIETGAEVGVRPHPESEQDE